MTDEKRQEEINNWFNTIRNTHDYEDVFRGNKRLAGLIVDAINAEREKQDKAMDALRQIRVNMLTLYRQKPCYSDEHGTVGECNDIVLRAFAEADIELSEVTK